MKKSLKLRILDSLIGFWEKTLAFLQDKKINAHVAAGSDKLNQIQRNTDFQLTANYKPRTPALVFTHSIWSELQKGMAQEHMQLEEINENVTDMYHE
jgi:hypothetical protein